MQQLSAAFAPPAWLEDTGRTSWLLVGALVLLGGLIWLLAVTFTIVGPVVVGTVVATVAVPIVALLERHSVPRALGAAIVLLGLIGIAALVILVVIGGITSQHAAVAKEATAAADRASGWLGSLGINKSGVDGAKEGVSSATPQIIHTLVSGIVSGIKGLSSFIFGLSLTALAIFFLLKDGPSMRRWVDGHLGVPRPVATTVTGGVIRSLRGYFRGVTLVAAFNGVVVGLGALALGVPLAGTIGVVTFVTAYIPFIGAFAAGAFAVVIALGAKGTTVALVMLVIVILANGLLQNLVQPFAMGSALDLHPLVVLVVTIGSGCIFGTIGLILAAPLTSAAVHVNRQLASARAAAALAAEAAGAEPAPG